MDNTTLNIIIIVVVGIVVGIGAEAIARKRPNIRGAVAVFLSTLLAAAGNVIAGGAALLAAGTGWLAAVAALIGALLVMVPWTVVRGGYGPYGRKRTWRRRFEK